jgi:hypothetical protein
MEMELLDEITFGEGSREGGPLIISAVYVQDKSGMGQYYQSSQAWPPTAGKTKEMTGMGNMANPWAGALSQEYNT